MQSNAPKIHSLTEAAPVVPDVTTHRTQGEGADLPTVLDLAANPATEGFAQRTLLNVCLDLFGKLEASLVTTRQEFIDAYFATLVKQDEMATLWTERLARSFAAIAKIHIKHVRQLHPRHQRRAPPPVFWSGARH